MRAGELNSIVIHHRRIVEEQRSGAVKERFEDAGKIRCSLPDPSGSTGNVNDRMTTSDTRKMYCRSYYAVKELDRIIIDGVTYYVDFVSNQRRANMLVLTLKRELL